MLRVDVNGENLSLQQVARLLDVERDKLRGGLNLVEATEVLGIAPSAVRTRALAREIGYQRDGRAWRFYWWHIRDYLQHREHPAANSTASGMSGAARQGGKDRTTLGTDGEIQDKARQMGLI